MQDEPETVEQLEEMLRLLDQFPEIADFSIGVIGAWIEDKQYEGVKRFENVSRYDAAKTINEWFHERIHQRDNQRTILCISRITSSVTSSRLC